MQGKPKPMPPAGDLWDRYSYNPLTGELFSRRRPDFGALGYCDGRYRQIHFKSATRSQRLLAHRLVWKWVTGLDPQNTIDHINRIGMDNRWWNLRDVNHTVQNRNSSNCKLSQEDIKEILRLCDRGFPQSVIALQYEVDQSRICQINRRRRNGSASERCDMA